jgi:tRNA acetyltransferase TAN1
MNRLQYKIELRIRNHTTLSRLALIEAIAQCVPEGHTVDLEDPELFIIVEVFKVSSLQTVSLMSKLHLFLQSICGVSVVRDYYKLQKFNVVEIANTHASENPTASVNRIE